MFHPALWLQNTLRNWMRGTLLGNLTQQLWPQPPITRLLVVCATRKSETDFWKKSALGNSLKIWLSNPLIKPSIAFENTSGLSTIYNMQIRSANTGDALLFVHDDVWLDDPQWIDKVLHAINRYDIVGVAGNTRICKDQPAWLVSKLEPDRFDWDHPHLSGSISHGERANGVTVSYGLSPAKCQLLDGVFLAARARTLQSAKVEFDEQFQFHFYDLDLCRSARRVGLSLGTWPIALTHQSQGSFLRPPWNAVYQQYRQKWGH
jgi:protein O-GlcNAc transferase